jgi:hypothetical protein
MTDHLERRTNQQTDRQEHTIRLGQEERSRIASELDESSTRDHVLVMSSAALDSLPIAGPLLSSVISERIPRRRWQRMIEFSEKVEEAMARIETQLDREFVQSDECADFVEEVLESTSRRDADGKRAYYATALANSISVDRPKADDRERMLDVLDQLRPAHLRLLADVARTHDLPPGTEPAWEMDWSDLEGLGVLPPLGTDLTTQDERQNLAGRVTPFGRRLVAWIGAGD